MLGNSTQNRTGTRPGTHIVHNRILSVSDGFYLNWMTFCYLMVKGKVPPRPLILKGIWRNLPFNDDLGPGGMKTNGCFPRRSNFLIMAVISYLGSTSLETLTNSFGSFFSHSLIKSLKSFIQNPFSIFWAKPYTLWVLALIEVTLPRGPLLKIIR